MAALLLRMDRFRRGNRGGLAFAGRLRLKLGKFHLVGRVEKRHRHRRHPERLAVASTGEDHIFHAGAAQALGALLTQHPTDGVTEVRLAAPVRTNDGNYADTVKTQFLTVREGFESLDFNALEFEQSEFPSY